VSDRLRKILSINPSSIQSVKGQVIRPSDTVKAGTKSLSVIAGAPSVNIHVCSQDVSFVHGTHTDLYIQKTLIASLPTRFPF
jgi:hypothetical protein